MMTTIVRFYFEALRAESMMRIIESLLRLRRYPPVSCHLREFLHYLHYLHCFLIAPCSYLSVKTPFVKVRGIDFFLIWWHSCAFFTDLFFCDLQDLQDLQCFLMVHIGQSECKSELLMCTFANRCNWGHYSTYVLFIKIVFRIAKTEKTLFSLLSAFRQVTGLACQAPTITRLFFRGHPLRKWEADCRTLLRGHRRKRARDDEISSLRGAKRRGNLPFTNVVIGQV